MQDEFDHEAGVTSLCMHTDGSSIATGTRDGQVITWDSSTNVPLLQLQGKIRRFGFTKDLFTFYHC